MPEPPKGYEWDPKVNEWCWETYGFSLADVTHIFNDEEYDYLRIELSHPEEKRLLAIGRMDGGQIVAVVYTMREGRRRIITVHPAPHKQRAAFWAHNGREG